ncbi:MAG: 3-dehydroquinate synthase [Lachnospiraceae bacterium]|nr:3-dehydroquinate synthase [Lachnospiraceae bacterium]
MDTINISSRLYDYSVDFVESFDKKLEEFDEATVYVIDSNVYDLYKEKFKNLDMKKIYLMEAVEHKKNMDTVLDIISFWQKLGVRKNWKVVCFGGGITQDVTTIAANLFLRNIDWYFFPTTLLSMSDSCIGGKCGINLGAYKNQIGVFYPPKKIFIDVNFVKTLTDGDYLNGWGEILKFSLTSDKRFYEDLKKEEQYIPCERIADYIHRGLYVKKVVIEEDEFESDLRRVLNYGHTFGHALEAYTDNVIPHGKGVIWGIDVVNYIAAKEGLISEEYYYDIKRLIKEAFLKEEVEVQNADELFEIIKTDKKVKDNIMSFAMLDGESHLIVYPMPIDSKLNQLFKEYLKETHEYYNN